MTMTYEQVRLICAEAAHEMNAVYCRALGDATQATWAGAHEWQRTSCLNGVDSVFAGSGPRALHELWCAEKITTGWVYGPEKSVENKTHPCLVDYDALPVDQKAKDTIFLSTIHTMAQALGHPVLALGDQDVTVHEALRVTTRPV